MTGLLGVLLDLSLRACVAAAGVGLALAVLRVRAAAARHAAWTAMLAAMLLMAPLRNWLPAIPIAAPVVSAPEPVLPEIMPVETATPSASAPVGPRVSMPDVQPALERRINWMDLAAVAYLLGLAISLGRLILGWHAARVFARSCVAAGDAFYESARAVTPVTTGILRTRIVVPRDWRNWPVEKLRVVLAHERAHARRRDNLVNALALLNCAVYWFHPLAWWLRRELASLAEAACDDAALAVASDSRGYAAILLDLADAARRSGGRLLWQSGMHGADRLEQRIGRILDERRAAQISKHGRAALALACCAVLVFAAACQRETVVAPLRDDPARLANDARNKALRDSMKAAGSMTAAQVAELEAQIAKNPEDMDAAQAALLLSLERAQCDREGEDHCRTASADPMVDRTSSGERSER